jgi:hypothetical protein
MVYGSVPRSLAARGVVDGLTVTWLGLIVQC